MNTLCDGDDNAFHTLMEADKSVLPMLIQQFAAHTDGVDRARIIEVIWQHRDKSTIPFLASALYDPHPDVWQQALDGLVAIEGAESHRALAEFRSDISQDNERALWGDEAIVRSRLGDLTDQEPTRSNAAVHLTLNSWRLTVLIGSPLFIAGEFP